MQPSLAHRASSQQKQQQAASTAAAAARARAAAKSKSATAFFLCAFVAAGLALPYHLSKSGIGFGLLGVSDKDHLRRDDEHFAAFEATRPSIEPTLTSTTPPTSTSNNGGGANDRPSPMLRARFPARRPSAGPTPTRARGTSVPTRATREADPARSRGDDGGEERELDNEDGVATDIVPSSSPSSSLPSPSRRSALLSTTAASLAAAASAAATSQQLLFPSKASALLTSPNARLPRSPEAALRRSVPSVNPEVAAARSALESVAFKLRIPQRKPWDAMAADVGGAAAILGDRSRALALTPPDAVGVAEAAAASAVAGCERVKGAIDARDADVTASRLNSVLADVAALQLAQAPGLPYELPREFSSYPRLAGRAVVELDIEKRGGSNSDVFDLRDGRVSKTATLELTLDGYAAPLTAGNFLYNVTRGAYDGTPLAVSATAVLAGSGARGVPTEATLPLEILPAGAFEPLYRSPLDVAGGELPLLPLSVYGALAASRPRGAPPSEASASEFFVFLYSRQQAGLGGLAFEEGEFSVFGYATSSGEGASDAPVLLPQISQGDVIVRSRVVSGRERLVSRD